MQATRFFTDAEKVRIMDAIRSAERNTSGEIRLHIENSCKVPVLDRAADVFSMLGMHRTKLRNGVLFYLAVGNRQFAILGDAGINHVVPDGFWDSVREKLEENFARSEFAEGLAAGIEMAGEQLKSHFPHEAGDMNELPDDISFGQPDESKTEGQ